MNTLSLVIGVLLDAVIALPVASGDAFAAEAVASVPPYQPAIRATPLHWHLHPTQPADDETGSAIAPHSAVLHTGGRRLQLLPTEDTHFDIRMDDARCAAGPTPPAGLWMVTRDGDGQPQLIAPSATPLPAGHDGQIRLTPCGHPAEGDAPQLALPEPVIDLLAARAGLVLIAD